MSYPKDPLAAARGIIIGLGIAIPFWVIIFIIASKVWG